VKAADLIPRPAVFACRYRHAGRRRRHGGCRSLWRSCHV